MSLYSTLAEAYDDLFPLPQASVDFLDSLVPSPSSSSRRALDAGCATGSLVLALAERGWEAIGIEPEARMVELARAKASRLGIEGAAFAAGDMLDARRLASGGPFDLVLCLGNTLPHLTEAGARRFFEVSRELLKPSGFLVLQLLNYTKAGVGPGFAFPEVAAAGYAFRRRYEAGPGGRLRFVAELSGEAGTEAGGEVLLSPLEPAWIASALGEAGFAPPSLASGWDGGGFDPVADLYLVAVARLG